MKNKSNVNYLPSSFHNKFCGYTTKIITKEDIQKLKDNDINDKGNRVTDFTSWIYDSIIPKRNNNNLEEGKLTEQLIYDNLIRNIDKSDSYFRSQYSKILTSDWDLEFEDLSEGLKNSYSISNLIYNDKPLHGKPDIVYRNIKTNDRIIIEVKSTSSTSQIPLGGWYNLQCQLWSYSQIDHFKSSKNIFLMGDIRIRKVNYPDKKKFVYIGGERINNIPYFTILPSGIYPRWRIKKQGELNLNHKEVKKFHEQCKMIFEIYGGKYKDVV
jgi:hypothetical protein